VTFAGFSVNCRHGLTLAAIGDDDEMPCLAVERRRRLHRDFDAPLDDVTLDGPRQV
jgi:hypothetical protein